MGQKVNPHGMRVGVIKDWDSRWYASNEKVGDLLVEDHKIRVYLKKLLFAAGVSKIEIERSNEVVTIYLHVARPGVVIGKGGEQIEQYRKDVEKLIGKDRTVRGSAPTLPPGTDRRQHLPQFADRHARDRKSVV